MKLAFAAVILLSLCASAGAEPSAKLQVTAKVADAPKGPILCGVIQNFAVIRFEVIAVEKGTYDAKDLFVVAGCPEGFKTGWKLRLVLEQVKIAGVGYKERFTDPAPRYRAIRMTSL